jgi:hypothetical protein
MKKALDSMSKKERKEYGYVPTKLSFWILRFEFYTIFMCHKMLLCSFSADNNNKKKNVKSILEAGQIWLVGQFANPW